MVLCLFFAVWFESGIIMMYVPFPSLDEADRLAAAPAIDISQVAVGPAAALADSGLSVVDRATLIQAGERPAWLFRSHDGSTVAVAADDGTKLSPVTDLQAATLGERFLGGESCVISGPLDYDQWVVHQRFDPDRPFYKASCSDDAGTTLYIAQRTGEILQRTTRIERFWNYPGSVAHWLYPTVLRRHWSAWDQTVWWLSLVALISGVAGFVVGIARSTRSLQSKRRPTLSAYRSWMKWHHLAGLAGGAFLLIWSFSGWLSMDHGRLFSTDSATSGALDRYRGQPLEGSLGRLSVAALADLRGAAEIEATIVAGHAFFVGRYSDGRLRVLAEGSNEAAVPAIPSALLIEAIGRAWPDAPIGVLEDVPADDGYRRFIGSPSAVSLKRVVVHDAAETWIYLDAGSGRILSVVDRSRRLYRWLYYGLHTFDLPGLADHPLIRQGLMLAFLVTGFGLSVTGIVIAVRRLRLSLPLPKPQQG